MSETYREVASATDAITIEKVFNRHGPAAVVVQAAEGWAAVTVMADGKELSVLMSRAELIRLFYIINEADTHLYRTSWQGEARDA